MRRLVPILLLAMTSLPAVAECPSPVGNPPGGAGAFDVSGQLFFLVNRGPAEGQKLELPGATLKASVKYDLLKIDPKTAATTVVASFAHRNNASLLVQDGNEKQAQVVAFDAAAAPCFRGEAAVSKLRWREAKPELESRTGKVELTDGQDGRQVRDLAAKAPKVAASGRTIQQGAESATIRPVQGGKAVELARKGQKTYTFKLPEGVSFADARFDAAFDRHVVVVSGASALVRRKWQRTYLIDYASGELLGAIPAAGREVLGVPQIAADGSYVALDVKDGQSNVTTGLRLFDVAKKTYAKIEP